MLFIRDENETSKFAGEGGRKHLKAPPGAKANQLNHYVIPTFDKFDYD